MSILDKIRSGAGQRANESQAPKTVSESEVEAARITVNPDKNEAGVYPEHDSASGKPENDVPSEHVQVGVQKIEAVTMVWTKKSLVFLLVK